MRLLAHPLVNEIRSIQPGLFVEGGSFARELPEPSDVPAADRAIVFDQMREKAAGSCLSRLLGSAGLGSTVPPRTAQGYRAWPDGFVGSVSHKGTVVVGVLALTTTRPSVGIDIETVEPGGLPGVPLWASDEQPPPVGSELAPHIAFSAKEAVFKATFPLTHERLAFEDIRITWSRSDRLHGLTDVGASTVYVVSTQNIAGWIASLAFVIPRRV